MPGQEDVARTCLTVAGVSKVLSPEEIVTVVRRHGLNTRVLNRHEVPGGENDPNKRRWVLLLDSEEHAKRLYQVIRQEDVEIQGQQYRMVYEQTIPFEVPGEWLTDTDPDPSKEPEGAQQGLPCFTDLFMSGRYENVAPNYPAGVGSSGLNNPAGDAGQGQHQGFHPVGGFGQMPGPGQMPGAAQMPRGFIPGPGNVPGRMQYPFVGATAAESKAVADQEDYMKRLQRKIDKEEEAKQGPPSEYETPVRSGQDEHVYGGDDTPDGDTDCPTKIKVTDLPSTAHDEFITLIFEKYGDGEVVNVEMDEDNNSAIVEFEDVEAVQRVLQTQSIMMMGTDVKVEQYRPEPEIPPPRDTVEVLGIDESMSEEYIKLYFENKRRSGGGPIFSFVANMERGAAYITFEREEVAQRVVDHTQHVFNKKPLQVQLYLPVRTQKGQPIQEEVIPEEPELPSCTVVVRGIKRIKSHETLRLYFENKRRSHGGPVSDFSIDEEDPDAVFITFEKPEVAEEVTNYPHKVEGFELDVELHKAHPCLEPQPSVEEEEEEEEEEKTEPPRTVKVIGIKKMKSVATLEYYFENNRKSGGGELEEDGGFHIDEEDDDVVFVTFKDENDAQTVASRSHKVEGVKLVVSLYIPPPPPKPRPLYTDKALFSGVKTTTTKDRLFNFLEAKTGTEPKSLVYGEIEGTVLVTFETDPDFGKLEEVCRKYRLEGAAITVSGVPISNCIMVSNLMENTTEETVQYYFENTRRSGGGEIEKIAMCEDNSSCLVFFIDHEVVDRVLGKEHTINRKLNVRLHLECLGNVQAGGDTRAREREREIGRRHEKSQRQRESEIVSE